MTKAWSLRMTALLMAMLFFVSFSFSASAGEYDPNYPEELSEGHLNATSAILIEAESGEVIFKKNADAKMHPASTTKIMTVWLALNSADPDMLVTVSENAVNVAEDESTAKLAAGEEVRLIDLMYAAMLLSGNDAATAIAEGVGGSVENFAYYMTQAAQALGCKNTNFVNANGLTDENHYSTAEDLAIITRVAMQNPTFRQIAGTTSYVMPKDNIYRSREIVTGVRFILPAEKESGMYYEYSTGVKTGTTSAAGRCFVGSATKDGVSLISVVLGCTTDKARYTDTIKLMDYGFSQFKSTSIAEIYAENPRVIDIQGFALDDPEVGRLQLELRKVDPAVKDLIVTSQDQIEYWVQNFNSITVTDFTRPFRAPVEAGEVMGTLTYYPEDGGSAVVYEMLATRTIAAREQLFPTIDQIISDAENDKNPFPRITFELVFLHVLLPAAGIWLLVKIIKFLKKRIRRHRRVKAHKPQSRYYR
ncbi:MAG: D-alanyl-D-alanine carboxypeptidase [Clostridia bacterium]|nr:D-alanyl-D-alanine carboxypeptidase [Clostridia bacterium]